MGLFDILLQPLEYALINELSRKQTDVSAECEDSVRVMVDSGEIVFHSNLYNN